MRNHLKITALFVIISAIIFAFWGKKFVWRRVSGTEITVDGKVLPASNLYKSFGGDYVLMLEYDDDKSALYVIRPNETKVGIQSRIKFSRLPFCLISSEYPVYPITNDSEKASALDAKPVVEETSISFVSYPSNAVKVTW